MVVSVSVLLLVCYNLCSFMKNIKSKILDCLQDLKGSGKFASVGSIPFVLPGLLIDKKEEISFPLSKNETKKLINFA